MTTNTQHPSRSRETSEAEKVAHAREQVRAEASRGINPHTVFPADDLAWAFEDAAHELEALVEEAERVQAQRARAEQAANETRKVRDLTDKILIEWDADRRRDAEVEARRRLGIEAA